MGLVPENVQRFARILIDAGYSTYLVGGAVRNLLHENSPTDWDIATNATPHQVKKLYRRTIPTGIRHGTVTVLFQNDRFEVTTFRTDSAYSDGRHPDVVHFTSTIEQDLARRDFTINAIAVDLASGNLHDPHEGRADLAARRLRTVGNASERFAEDRLRLFRGCRLAAELNLTVDADTVQSMTNAIPTAGQVATERIGEELRRLMIAPTPSVGLHLLERSGLIAMCFPMLNSNRNQPGSPNTARYGHIDSTPRDLVRRLAILLSPVTAVNAPAAATHAQTELIRLRFPNEIAKKVSATIHGLGIPLTAGSSDAAIRQLLATVGRENAEDAIAVRQATDSIDERLAQRVRFQADSRNALSIRELAVNGGDLQRKLGLCSGPRIGTLLKALLQKVLEDPSSNDRVQLLRAAQAYQSEARSAVLPSLPTSFK